MISTLMANMLRSNPGISYQFARLLSSGTGDQFTAEAIKEQIFRIEDHNVLFLFSA